MKVNKLFILSLIIINLFTSCTGDWLDTTKEGTPTENNFWKTDNDYIGHVTVFIIYLVLKRPTAEISFGSKVHLMIYSIPVHEDLEK
jgi:hypothetical protein